jgi:hypothetical protein
MFSQYIPTGEVIAHAADGARGRVVAENKKMLVVIVDDEFQLWPISTPGLHITQEVRLVDCDRHFEPFEATKLPVVDVDRIAKVRAVFDAFAAQTFKNEIGEHRLGSHAASLLTLAYFADVQADYLSGRGE